MDVRVGDRAIVLGGSIAGLLAARVLSEAYHEVVIVDRDQLIGVTTARRGVPQGRHVHGVLARGQQVFDELFPGFTADTVAAGVPTGDLGECRWFFNGRELHHAATGIIAVSAGRPVLEGHLRNRVAALPNVKFLEETDIIGLVATPDKARVIGARVQRHGDDGAPETLDADLVVDATGRASRTPVWLEELGYQRPEETRIKINLSYTSRRYRTVDQSVVQGNLSINPVSTPGSPRGAFLSEIEHGRYVLSLTGVLGEAAPTDPDGFLAWAKSLPIPHIYLAVRDGEPLDDPVTHRYPASVRRHYERLTRFPAGFLVLGDAACSFNPVYGQGISVSALEALELREHLLRGTPQPRRFFKAISRIIDVPWDISAGSDLGHPEIEGHRPPKVRIGNAYMAKLHAAAVHDGSITRAFMRVAGLVEKPQALMRPGVILRVLRNANKPIPAMPDPQTGTADGPVQRAA